MQRIRAIVDRRVVKLVLNRKMPTGNAIGYPADGRAEVRILMFVLLEIVITEHNIAAFATLVRHMQLRDPAAEGQNLHTHAVVVGEDKEVNSLTRFAGAEWLLFYFHGDLSYSAKGTGRECRKSVLDGVAVGIDAGFDTPALGISFHGFPLIVQSGA